MNNIATGKYKNLDNPEYWKERSLEVSDSKWKDIKKVEKEMAAQYRIALDDIQKDLEAFYTRYSIKNNISYNDAIKQLNQYELGNIQSRMNSLKQQITVSNNPFAKGEIERLVAQMEHTRLQSLMFQVDSRLIELAGSQQVGMDDWLMKTYSDVYLKTGYNISRGTGIGIGFSKLNERAIQKSITYPWSGQMFSERIWFNRSQLVRELKQTITNGMIRGSSVQKMSRELRDKMDSSYKNSLRLIRTETANVIGEASNEGYREYGVEQYLFIAELGERTCEDCARLDGQTFDVKDRQAGTNASPIHANCRCTEAPYFGNSPTFRRARDEDGGNEVIPYQTFNEWSNKYVK